MAKGFSNYNYHVFLSFSGDTRSGFTAHLFGALRRSGITTFVDDLNLRARDEIEPAVLKAIEESRISIIVLSKNYASSILCLDELVKILQSGTVFPIFYQVDPSDVRHLRNSYAEAMTAHEIRFGKISERLLKWRSALAQVSYLSEYLCSTGDNEYEFIEKIANEVSTRLSSDKPGAGSETKTSEAEGSNDVMYKEEPEQNDAPIEEVKSDSGSTMKVPDESRLNEWPKKLHNLKVRGYRSLESLPKRIGKPSVPCY